MGRGMLALCPAFLLHAAARHTMKPVLILHTGDPETSLAQAHGNYAQMLRIAAGLKASDVEIVAVYQGQRPQPPQHYRAALITGSPAMVTDLEPWSEDCAGWLREAAATGLPMFGICYGHQLLAHALGGKVAYNPLGRELGTHELELTAEGQADPLLDGIPAHLTAQMMHLQTVSELPPQAVVLARSAMDAHQMLRLAPGVYSTQFHPEFIPAFVSAHIAHYRAPYEKEGLNTAALPVCDTPWAASLLQRFLAQHARQDRAAA